MSAVELSSRNQSRTKSMVLGVVGLLTFLPALVGGFKPVFLTPIQLFGMPLLFLAGYLLLAEKFSSREQTVEKTPVIDRMESIEPERLRKPDAA